MDKDLLKLLQDKTKVRPFDLMSPNAQALYKEVGLKNCRYFCEGKTWKRSRTSTFAPAYTYVVDKTYTPPPDYVWAEVKVIPKAGLLGVYVVDCAISIGLMPPGFGKMEFIFLYSICAIPSFIGFRVIPPTDKRLLNKDIMSAEVTTIEFVAKEIKRGDKVYAGFAY